MIESIKTFLLVIILIYAIVITVLYWTEYINKKQYLQEKSNNLNEKEIEFIRREKSIVDKEVCFRELTKLQTIQNSALNLLKSYESNYLNAPSNAPSTAPSTVENVPSTVENVPSTAPNVESENSWISTMSNIIR